MNYVLDKSFKLFRPGLVVVMLMTLLLGACNTVDNGPSDLHLVQLIVTNNGRVNSSGPETVPKGAQLQLLVVGVYSNDVRTNLTKAVVWKSSDQSVAVVSGALDQEGLVSGMAEGPAVITASIPAAGVEASIDILVTPAVLKTLLVSPDGQSIPRGQTIQFNALGTLIDFNVLDYTEKVVWSSSDTSLLTINNTEGSRGLAKARVLPESLKPNDIGGSVTVTAQFLADDGSVIQDEVTIEVRPAEFVGLVVAPDTLVMNPLIIPGQQYTATAIYTDGATEDLTSSVVWEADDVSVAMVSSELGSEGYITGLGSGSTTITANDAAKNISGSAQLTVTNAALDRLDVTPGVAELPEGRTLALTATGVFTDSLIQDLTEWVEWSSSNLDAASVDNIAGGSKGVVHGEHVGSATVTALVSAMGVSGASVITVTNPILTSIDIAPSAFKLAMGESLQLAATGNYENGSSVPLAADSLTWESSDSTKLSVSATGLLSAVSISDGGVAVTATDSSTGISGTASGSVVAARIVSVALATRGNVTPEIAKNTRLSLNLTGTYSDGSTKDLTQSSKSTFYSRKLNIATVNNGISVTCPGSGTRIYRYDMGEVTGLDAGSVALFARYSETGNNFLSTDDLTLQVKQAVLQSITILPNDNIPLALGTQQLFSATGNFDDGTTQDITRQVNWTSTNTSVATVENRDLSIICSNNKPPNVPGRVTAVGIDGGTTDIIATEPVSGLSVQVRLSVF